MREGLGIGQVVDRYDLKRWVCQCRPINEPANSTKAVNAYPNRHKLLILWNCPKWFKPRQKKPADHSGSGLSAIGQAVEDTNPKPRKTVKISCAMKMVEKCHGSANHFANRGVE